MTEQGQQQGVVEGDGEHEVSFSEEFPGFYLVELVTFVDRVRIIDIFQ